MKSFALLFLLFGAHQVNGADFFLINETLPVTIKHYSTQDQLPENNQAYTTPLGVTSRCFKGSHFLIISQNTLGSGYEFTQLAPQNAICIPLIDQAKPLQNPAGMHLGMQKKQALEMLNITEDTAAATVLYNQEITIDGKKMDEQTWVDVEFSGDKLSLLKIFVSLSN